MNYVNIKIKNIQDNIDYIKNNFNYKYYILDVSNNAFYHGMYIINEIRKIDFLYVNNFKDLLLVRNYNKNIPTIYSGNIDDDNIYDLIMHNAILVIDNLDILNYKDIKDDVQIILRIDPKGYKGFNNQEEIKKLLSFINENKHIKLLGIIATICEDDYDSFKDIILPLPLLEVVILNNENDKNKIKGSNAIKLDNSIYGFNKVKKEVFKKEIKVYKQAFTIKAKIINIKNEKRKKKDIRLGIINIGFQNGMIDKITKVKINNILYEVSMITEEYSLILIDDNVKVNDWVIITDEDNPLQNYIDGNIWQYLSFLENKFPILYDEEIKLIC